jgi:hypothetical protein
LRPHPPTPSADSDDKPVTHVTSALWHLSSIAPAADDDDDVDECIRPNCTLSMRRAPAANRVSNASSVFEESCVAR